MKSLDAGAYGIVCPMINTPAECEEFIQNCCYAPRAAPLVWPDPRRE